VSGYGKTETTVRRFDEAGRLVDETVTTVVHRRVIDAPVGFFPVPDGSPAASDARPGTDRP